MIATGTSVVATAVVVTAGHWVADKKLDIRVAAGLGVMAMTLAFLDASNTNLASQFALLILVGAVFLYAQPITKALGYTK